MVTHLLAEPDFEQTGRVLSRPVLGWVPRSNQAPTSTEDLSPKRHRLYMVRVNPIPSCESEAVSVPSHYKLPKYSMCDTSHSGLWAENDWSQIGPRRARVHAAGSTTALIAMAAAAAAAPRPILNRVGLRNAPLRPARRVRRAEVAGRRGGLPGGLGGGGGLCRLRVAQRLWRRTVL